MQQGIDRSKLIWLKVTVEQCVKTAQTEGLSDLEICVELLEQVRLLTCKQVIKLVSKREH